MNMKDSNTKYTIFGFKVHSGNGMPDYYMLVKSLLAEAKEIPLLLEGEFVICSKRNTINTIADIFGVEGIISTKIDDIYIIDIDRCLKLISNDESDENSVILNALNGLLDVVDVIPYAMPDEYRRNLALFANHITFQDEIKDFLSVENRRQLICDALFWLTGAISLCSRQVRSVSHLLRQRSRASTTQNMQ